MAISPNSLIRGPSVGTLEQARAYVVLRSGPAALDDFTDLYLTYLYEMCQRIGVRFELAFAQWCDETGVGTSKYWREQRNPAGLGALEAGDSGITYVGGTFTDPRMSALAHLAHLWLYIEGTSLPVTLTGGDKVDPRWQAALSAGKAGSAPTLGKLAGSWADNPNYAVQIAAHANRAFGDLPEGKADGSMGMVQIGKRKLRYAVGAGHRNNSGGNTFETGLTGKVTNELVKLMRAQPDLYDVRCFTPGDGLGWYDGPLDAAARQVATWANQGWVADIFHEVHFQGLGSQAPRGGFLIYPDGAGLSSPYPNPGDIDLDAKAFGPEYARIMCAGTGVPVWGSGIMSERATGVGGQGYRLGIFGATASDPLINACTRILTEGATYTNPQDLAIMQAPGFALKHAKALLAASNALAERQLGWVKPVATTPAPEPAPAPDVALDGQPYPQGWDKGLLEWAFGKVTIEDTTPEGVTRSLVYAFGSGPVSKAWYHYGKVLNGLQFPELKKVRLFRDPLPEGKYQERIEFLFSDGLKIQTINGKVV